MTAPSDMKLYFDMLPEPKTFKLFEGIDHIWQGSEQQVLAANLFIFVRFTHTPRSLMKWCYLP
jgi:hypothetical protein